MNQTEQVLWQLKNRDIHDPDFRWFHRLAGTQGLFVDVGANRGQSAVSMRMVWPECRIEAFEPSPNREVQEALGHIAGVLGNMTVHLAALGAAGGEAVMVVPSVDGQEVLEQGTLAPAQMLRPYIIEGLLKLGREITTARVPVSVVPLDSYELAPAVIKVDVEGYELEVLKGAAETIRKHKPVLLIENSDWQRVADYLAGFGYGCYRYIAEDDSLIPLDIACCNSFYLLA